MVKKRSIFMTIVVVVLVAMLGTVLAACGGGAATPEGTAAATETAAGGATSEATAEGETPVVSTEAGGEGILRFNNGAEPETLDPALMTGDIEFNIVRQILEGLTISNNEDVSKNDPGMAETWDISADGLTYTFHLRDAKWSNGDAVTANDFVYSWERVLNPATASEYAYQLFYIKNAAGYNDGSITDFTQVGVQATDDKTLVVTLENPTPYFLQMTSFMTLLPVNQKAVAANPDDWTKPENIVTNGPFILKEWNPNQNIVLEKNANYWDAANVKLNRVVAYPIEDNNTALSMYEAGELDWVRQIPLEAVDAWKGNPEYQNYTILSTYFYRFNVTKAPFDNVNVRKAFDMAVDKQAIVDSVTRQGQIPAKAFVPLGMPNYQSVDDQGFAYDVEQAKQLLADAGYPNGEGFPTVQLLYNTSESHKAIAEAIQQMWKENLGVNVELVNQEWKVYLKSQSTLDYQVSRSGWIGDYVDPNTFLDMFVTDGGNNQTGWSNARYDELIAQAAKTQDNAERMKLFNEAEKILVVDEMPIMPIYYYTNNNLVKPYVKGMSWNLQDSHLLKYASVDAH